MSKKKNNPVEPPETPLTEAEDAAEHDRIAGAETVAMPHDSYVDDPHPNPGPHCG